MAQTRIDNKDIKKPLTEENVTLASGVDILPNVDGQSDLGSASYKFGTIYADSFVGSLSGSFVRTSGDTMTGNLTIGSGANMYTAVSGLGNIGQPTVPFNNVFANAVSVNTLNIGGESLDVRYVNVTGDTMTGNLNFSQATAVISGSNQLHLKSSGGTYMNSPSLSITTSGTVNTNAGSSIISQASTSVSITAQNGDLALATTGGGANKDVTIDSTGQLLVNATNRIFFNTVGGTGTRDIDFYTAGGKIQLEAYDDDINIDTQKTGGIGPGADINITSRGTNKNVNITATNGNINVASSIIPTTNGTRDLGSTGLHFRNIYVDNIISTGSAGDYVNVTGDTMTGQLIMDNQSVLVDHFQGIGSRAAGQTIAISASSGVYIGGGAGNVEFSNGGNIILGCGGYIEITSSNGATLMNGTHLINNSSGNSNIGSANYPFGTLWVNAISGVSLDGSYVNTTGDTMTGALTISSGGLTVQNGSITVSSGSSVVSVGITNTIAGNYSVGFGNNNTAGQAGFGNSTVLGNYNNSNATRSTAVGYSNEVSGTSSTAIGDDNITQFDYSLSAGYQNSARSYYSAAVGMQNTTAANYTSAFGYNNQASGSNSTVIGYQNITDAFSTSSIAAGYQNTTINSASANVFGFSNNISNGSNSTVIGSTNSITGSSIGLLGAYNKVSGNGAGAFGSSQTVIGNASYTFGGLNTLNGNSSVILGTQNTISGNNSHSLGYLNSISGNSSFAVGEFIQITGNNIIVIGDTITATGSSTLYLGHTNGVVLSTGNFVPSTSGTQNIGSSSNPFSGVFANPIIQSPNGSLWKIVVDNSGNLSTVAFP